MPRVSGFIGVCVVVLSLQHGRAQTNTFDITAWKVIGDANWTVEQDVVQASRGFGFLVTPVIYDDFELTVDIWVSHDANTGVYIRCTDPAGPSSKSGYEVNIYDQRPDPTYRTGAIVNLAPPLAKIDAGGQWNTLHIQAVGPKMTVVLNGVTTVREAEDTKFDRGPIALQYGRLGVVKFRNVRIRAL